MLSRRLAVLVVLASSFGLVAARAEAAPAPQDLAPVAGALAGGDPLAFRAAEVKRLEAAAAFGHSKPLYTMSPGGAIETARRTAHWRPQIERAVAGSGFSADVVEGIVFLESAGRHDAIAGSGPHVASGLVQIMGGTANDFLGMNVNLQVSDRLTRQIAVARKKRNHAAVRGLEARRRQVDARFDPPRALAAAVRYLTAARGYLGRNDLAVTSYHMGIGNLQNALKAYGGGTQANVSYTQLYFDSGPDRNADAWNILLDLSDDSRHYYFKVLAAKRIMHLYRSNPAELARLSTQFTRKHSHEEVMHPAAATKVFTAPREIATARTSGELLALPSRPAQLHFEVSHGMGSLAPTMGLGKATYRGLRPEALATLTYIAQRVQQVGNTKTPITVTSTIRDWKYQSRLMKTNRMAARTYSVHTTGYAFDIARAWNSRRQAAAVQFVLDRLVSHGLIAYIKEPHAIHVAVSKDAAVLIPTMLEGAPPAPAAAAEPAAQPAAEGEAHPEAHRPLVPLLDPPAPAPRPAQTTDEQQRDSAEAGTGFFRQLREFLGVWAP